MIDYGSVDFLDLLEQLNIRNGRMTSGGIEVSYSCHRPEHSQGDESPSAYINSETGAFYCHMCHFKGQTSDLVADVQQVSRATAERWLCETYGLQFNEPIGGSMVAELEARLRPAVEPSKPIQPPESWLTSTRLDWYASNLEPFQLYMLGRGLSPEILARFDVGYDYRSDRITIPVRDLDGRLVGIKGRDWAGRHPAKYLPIGDSPSATARGDLRYGFGTYEISQVVFGLCYAREYKKAVVVEGEFNAMALAQLGVDRPIGTNTARMSPRQARLIVDECQEVIFLYDRGQAGHDGAHAGAELLSDHLVVRIAEPLDVDPCDALRDGRGAEVVRAIERAPSVLALTTVPW